MKVTEDIFGLAFHASAVIFCLYLIRNIVSFVVRQHRLNSSLSKLPHFKYWPIISYWTRLRKVYGRTAGFPPNCYILQVIAGTSQVFMKQKIFLVWLMHRPLIFVFDTKMVETVMSSNELIEKGFEYSFLHSWLGTGLLTSGGEKWRTRRKLLTPTFHFRILEDFVSIFNEQASVLVSKIKEKSHKECIDIIPFVTMFTLDVICQSTMGVCIHAQRNPENEYVKAIHEIGYQFIYRLSRPWLWSETIFHWFPIGRKYYQNLKIVHGFTRKVIREKKKELLQLKNKEDKGITNKSNNELTIRKKRKAFLELLLELHINDSALSEEDIKEEVDTFMFEGHDTTAMAICWCLYNIGLRPDIQERIYNEIYEIFADDKERPLTIDDIKAMKYLECVLKESLRLFPSVPFIGREIQQETTLGGYTLASGSFCVLAPFLIHRDPDIYPNPEVFDPDRFLPENSVQRNPFAYVPFSGGPRNCIGQKFAVMEEKTVIAHIIRNFRIRSLDQRDRVVLQPDMILRPCGPVRLQMVPR